MIKQEQRTLLKGIRKSMTDNEIAEKSRRAAENFCNTEEFHSAETVFIYISLPKEVATADIIAECFRCGKRVVVPVTEKGEISLCLLENMENLTIGEFGISEPSEKRFWQGRVDIAVIPGLGFDRDGGRMGFGKGCYDKFLAENECIKVGLCFDAMMQEKIVTEAHDVPMDIVITETEIWRKK